MSWVPPKSMSEICVLGVWPWSLYPNRPPRLQTLRGRVAPGIIQRAMSIWCTPWLPMSPLPKSQNQCQL